MKKVKKTLQLTALHIFYVLLCFVGMVPVLYAFGLSLSGSGGALSSDLSLFPDNPTFENYYRIIVEEPFLLWFKNSIVLSAGTMFVAISFGVLAAYAFSRYRFKGRRTVLNLLLLLNAFPQILSMFALFRLFKNMGLLNSKPGLIFIYAGSMCIFSIWNLKGYFDPCYACNYCNICYGSDFCME